MYQIYPNREFNTIFRDQSKPELLHVTEVVGKPTWTHPMHKHEDMCELVLIVEGKGHYIINNNKYTAEKGDLLIYNKGVLHDESSDSNETLNQFILGCSNVFIEGLDDMCVIPSFIQPIVNIRDHFEIFKAYFQTIMQECAEKPLNYELISQNTLSNIIILINRIVQTSEKDHIVITQSELALKIKAFIDENYMKDIKLEDLSNQFHFSTYYLCHIFKKELFFSPIDYLIHRRIGEAQQLLLSTKLLIGEIAEKVGYTNVNYFGLIFKRVTSVSPGEFRNSESINRSLKAAPKN
ncbi:MAG: AraC family transcriptional regulator [Eubacteriales bacterium]|nr:AraC family transcriptional regulator [Eubacteriales bacterium]